MTLIIGIVALGAVALVIVMLAIAFVLPPMDDELIDKTERRTPSRLSHRRQVTVRRSGPMSAHSDAPARRAPRETRTTRAGVPARPAGRGITEAYTASRRKLTHDLVSLRARRRRGELDGATWVGVTLVVSVVLGYLIAHT